jgi:aryl-alcohol dehydrogenase-like predicted oxidoreductase
MEYRSFGRTGIKVSEIGFGAWGIGGGLWQGSEDKESSRALHRAVELGVNFIDTALAYGDGHSERLIGEFLKERRPHVTVATKIPPLNREWPAKAGTRLRDAFPFEHIIQSTEKSLKNLRADRIDVQQFHVWLDEWTDDNEWKDAVNRLKEESKLRFLGISINDHQPESALKAAASGAVDSVQVIYNIFDQSPEEKLFHLCQEGGVGVIVRVPFDEGSLTGAITPDTIFPTGDFRNRYFRGDRKKQVADRVMKLRELRGKEAETLPELALRFCLHHPAVSTVIPGMRKLQHVESNCVASDARSLSLPIIEELRNHAWVRNFYE